MNESHPIGRHFVHIEDNLSIIEWHGAPKLEELKSAFKLVADLMNQHKDVYILVDMRDTAVPDAATRRENVEWLASHRVAGAATFGTNRIIRTMMLLIQNAARLFSNETMFINHCETEAQARAWIEELRQKRAINQ